MTLAELANTGGNTDFQGWVSVKFYLSCIKNETFWGSPIENVEPPPPGIISLILS